MGAQNRPQEAPKEDKRRHRRKKNKNKREAAARSEQTRPKRVPRRIWKPSVVDVEAPRSPQGTSKGSQKEPKRAPTRSQYHLWIKNVDVSHM